MELGWRGWRGPRRSAASRRSPCTPGEGTPLRASGGWHGRASCAQRPGRWAVLRSERAFVFLTSRWGSGPSQVMLTEMDPGPVLALHTAWITAVTLTKFPNGQLASLCPISHYRQISLYLKLNRFLIWYFFFFFNSLKAHCSVSAPGLACTMVS